MIILPAIDLYEKKAVRLYKGEYSKMTVYSEDPPKLAQEFREAGAEWLHMVDLEGARCGGTPNFDIAAKIVRTSGLLVELGGRGVLEVEPGLLGEGVLDVLLVGLAPGTLWADGDEADPGEVAPGVPAARRGRRARIRVTAAASRDAECEHASSNDADGLGESR